MPTIKLPEYLPRITTKSERPPSRMHGKGRRRVPYSPHGANSLHITKNAKKRFLLPSNPTSNNSDHWRDS